MCIFTHTFIYVQICIHIHVYTFIYTQVPPTYYKDLRARLAESDTEVKEDLDTIENLKYVCDMTHSYV